MPRKCKYPTCATCGKPKEPMGRDHREGYCTPLAYITNPNGCYDYWKGEQPTYWWPEEFEQRELSRLRAKEGGE